MSSVPVLQTSNSVLNISGTDLYQGTLPTSSSLPHVPPSPCQISCTLVTLTDLYEEADGQEGSGNDRIEDSLFRPISTALEILGLSVCLRRVLSLFCLWYSKYQPSTKRQKRKSLLRNFLVFIIWSLGCVSINLVSGLFAILRAMFASRIYYAISRLGLGPSLQQGSRVNKDDASVTSILQDRLEVAHLAVKQLKNEGFALEEKLKDAGERIAKLDANQVDYAALNALQEKYDYVSAEITRLTKENEELKNNGSRLVKENAELRQCLAMKSSDLEDETDRLGILARLQNQCLDSCIFPQDDETPRKKARIEDQNEASQDSIIIVTDIKSPNRADCSLAIAAPTRISVPPPSRGADRRQPCFSAIGARSVLHSSAPRIEKATPAPDQPSGPNPIPVFTTVRPSLPPKASKLKPLLLTTRSSTSNSPRRNSIKHTSMRKYSLKQHENVKVGRTIIRESITQAPANSQALTKTLNPCAPAFTPRIAFSVPHSNNIAPAIPEAVKPVDRSAHKTFSPTFSPYVFSSPSPNSPFMRPAPARRQSDDTAFSTFTPTPPTPITPISISPVGFGTTAATPRSTRASSVKLIRARVALRNTKRIASGSSAIPPATPAGMRTVAGMTSKGAQAKARLIGKGMPPRRALREVTNADDSGYVRWPSI